MKEVEILVEVFDKKHEVLKVLKSKLKFFGIKKVLDVYFFYPNSDNLKPDIKGRLKESFRLRKKGDKNYLTYKIDNFDIDGKWIYSDEEETIVEDFNIAKKIITNLNFKPLVEVDNRKYIFNTNKYEIVLEEVRDLGLFLEVEKIEIQDGEDIVKVKDEIFEFIKSLGINTTNELNAGKPELLLNKK